MLFFIGRRGQGKDRGHNVSDGERRGYAMTSRLVEFTDCVLAFDCLRCWKVIEVRIQDLVSLYAPRKVGDIIGRLQCLRPRCGLRPDRVIIKRRLHDITLTGPGAYG